MGMRFIVTNELGKLAKRLRILGFDTIEYENAKTPELIIKALADDRIIVTRSKSVGEKLPKGTIVLASTDIDEQVRVLCEKLNLKIAKEKMFTRCTLCNEELINVPKDKIEKLVPPRVYEAQEIFKKCPRCGKIYWQGSHLESINNLIDKIQRGK